MIEQWPSYIEMQTEATRAQARAVAAELKAANLTQRIIEQGRVLTDCEERRIAAAAERDALKGLLIEIQGVIACARCPVVGQYRLADSEGMELLRKIYTASVSKEEARDDV